MLANIFMEAVTAFMWSLIIKVLKCSWSALPPIAWSAHSCFSCKSSVFSVTSKHDSFTKFKKKKLHTKLSSRNAKVRSCLNSKYQEAPGSRQITRTIYKMLHLGKGIQGALGLRCGYEGVSLEGESRIPEAQRSLSPNRDFFFFPVERSGNHEGLRKWAQEKRSWAGRGGMGVVAHRTVILAIGRRTV